MRPDDARFGDSVPGSASPCMTEALSAASAACTGSALAARDSCRIGWTSAVTLMPNLRHCGSDHLLEVLPGSIET